jgi:peptide chain release factor 3
MQFEVAVHRLEHEFGARTELEILRYTIARRVERAVVAAVESKHGTEVLERTDGTLVALFTDKWRMSTVAADLPPGSLLPMFGGDVEITS